MRVLLGTGNKDKAPYDERLLAAAARAFMAPTDLHGVRSRRQGQRAKINVQRVMLALLRGSGGQGPVVQRQQRKQAALGIAARAKVLKMGGQGPRFGKHRCQRRWISRGRACELWAVREVR